MVESPLIDVGEAPKFNPVDRATFEAIKDKLPNTLFEKNRARFFKLFKDQVLVNGG